jgi:hypothetical protein
MEVDAAEPYRIQADHQRRDVQPPLLGELNRPERVVAVVAVVVVFMAERNAREV